MSLEIIAAALHNDVDSSYDKGCKHTCVLKTVLKVATGFSDSKRWYSTVPAQPQSGDHNVQGGIDDDF